MPREITREAGKYAALFLFIMLIIAFVTGFLVADDSMKATYDESFEKYDVEDGHFTLEKEAPKRVIDAVEDEGVKTHELFYKDEEFDNGDSIRIYVRRKSVNREGLWEGRLPENAGEIAIDRLYAANNKMEVGDDIKIGDKEYRLSGLVALSDYSSLFKDNSQFMFDANHFSVAVMTKKGFDGVSDRNMNYCYSWINDDRGMSKKEAKEKADDVRDALIDSAYPEFTEEEMMRLVLKTGKTPEEIYEDRACPVKDFLGRYDNQAISFTGDDMGQDKVMILTILYLVIIVLAFIFAITTKSTMEKEAGEIGSLRASGYSRSELLVHYTALPVIVTLLAAIPGNILGYTLIKRYIDTVYYGSYSLMRAEPRFNREAFILTTLVPLIVIFVISLVVIYKELRRPPLDFLRGKFGKEKTGRAPAVGGGNFITRFRRRVFRQNAPAYVVMSLGVLLATILLIFCLGLLPLLDHFKGEIVDSQIAKYQYVLKRKDGTSNKNAEKYQMTTLKLAENAKDDIAVYGVEKGSSHLKGFKAGDGSNDVMVSSAYADKYGVKKGDVIKLSEEFDDESYSFNVTGVYDYAASMAVFMDIDRFNKVFERDEGDYLGYFSDVKLDDVKRDNIATIVTQKDLTIVADQMNDSMAGIFVLFIFFGIMIFVIVMYLLSKQIVDKNVKSISMTKILGYTDREIASIYSRNTVLVVLIVLAMSVLLANYAFEWIYRFAMTYYAGWMTFYIDPKLYLEIGGIGILSYLGVYFLQLRHIGKIDMSEALKGME